MGSKLNNSVDFQNRRQTPPRILWMGGYSTPELLLERTTFDDTLLLMWVSYKRPCARAYCDDALAQDTFGCHCLLSLCLWILNNIVSLE